MSFSAASGSSNPDEVSRTRIAGLGETASWWKSLWSRRDGRLAQVRDQMQARITALPDASRHADLAERIRQAEDPETLWALREPLMRVLVGACGETLARRRMTDITFMFSGLLDRERHERDSLAHFDSQGAWPTDGPARGLVREAGHVRTDH